METTYYTPATLEMFEHLRDPSTLQWYVVALLAVAIYVYAVEIERQNWNLVFAGLAFWGMDWLNEIANSIILHASGFSGLWTAPARSAFIILSGLNIEICFMFAIAGITLAKMLPADKSLKILGLPNRLFFALANSIFCVFVEVGLNAADMLIWTYDFWNVPHIWLIVIFGYLHFNLIAFWVHDMERVASKVKAVGVIYGLVLISVVIFGFGLGWL